MTGAGLLVVVVCMADHDERFMRMALDQAQAAADAGEVPVAYVTLRDGGVADDLAAALDCRPHGRAQPRDEEEGGHRVAELHLEQFDDAAECAGEHLRLRGVQLAGC